MEHDMIMEHNMEATVLSIKNSFMLKPIKDKLLSGT
jgi:hypothetical protein